MTSLPCAWEMKGGIMRRMSEDSLEKEATFIDGIKVQSGEDWVLVLPDPEEAVTHVLAEAGNAAEARQVAQEYARRIRQSVR